jgi:hypothetical protein
MVMDAYKVALVVFIDTKNKVMDGVDKCLIILLNIKMCNARSIIDYGNEDSVLYDQVYKSSMQIDIPLSVRRFMSRHAI